MKKLLTDEAAAMQSDLRAAKAKALSTGKVAEAEKEKARLAKRQFKQARKAWKMARKSAKKAAKLARRASKELKKCLDKVGKQIAPASKLAKKPVPAAPVAPKTAGKTTPKRKALTPKPKARPTAVGVTPGTNQAQPPKQELGG